MANSNPGLSEAQNQRSGSPGNSTALDQWRGLALVFVLVNHAFFFTGRVFGLGRVGVNLFFFISGVLVFRSLAGLRDTPVWEGTLRYWTRRLRRLYPAMAAYVLAIVPIVYAFRDMGDAATHSMSSYLQSAPFALFYAMDYYWAYSHVALGHLWSLGCEMQFYLLAPIIFLLGGKSFVQRNLVWGMLLLALVTWGFIGAIVCPKSDRYHLEIAVWPMMLGFFCEYRKDLFRSIPSAFFRWVVRGSVVALVLMMLLMFLLKGHKMIYVVVPVGTFAFIPCFLAYLGNLTLRGPIGRAMTWLGERTYSIYLWQEPFTLCHYLPNMLQPLGAVTATFLGGLWFRIFERPFLSKKRQQSVGVRKLPALDLKNVERENLSSENAPSSEAAYEPAASLLEKSVPPES